MALYVYSPDGIIVDLVARYPKVRLADGSLKIIDPNEIQSDEWLALNDVYPVTLATKPDDSSTETFISSVVNTGPGTFVQQWVHDADAHTKRLYVENVFAKRADLYDTQYAILRQWAIDAQNTTVTNANNTAVTQQVVDRLGAFFDRFADLLEALDLGR